MAKISVTKLIGAKLGRVFALCTDLDGAPGRITGIKKIQKLTDDPVGKGTRWRETRKIMGREVTGEVEVTAFEAERGYTVEAYSQGVHYRTAFEFEPFGRHETIVRCSIEMEPRTLAAKLFVAVSSGTIRKSMEDDLADLKAAAEGDLKESPAAAAVGG